MKRYTTQPMHSRSAKKGDVDPSRVRAPGSGFGFAVPEKYD